MICVQRIFFCFSFFGSPRSAMNQERRDDVVAIPMDDSTEFRRDLKPNPGGVAIIGFSANEIEIAAVRLFFLIIKTHRHDSEGRVGLVINAFHGAVATASRFGDDHAYAYRSRQGRVGSRSAGSRNPRSRLLSCRAPLSFIWSIVALSIEPFRSGTAGPQLRRW